MRLRPSPIRHPDHARRSRRAFGAFLALAGRPRAGGGDHRGRRTARRWRPGSCSTATPGSARGWRSRSTSSTTARRSAASCDWPAAARARPASGRAVDLPTQSDKVYILYAQPPAFGSELEIVLAAGRAEGGLHQGEVLDPRHDPARRRGGRRASRGRSSATCASCPTRTRSRRCVMSVTPEDLPERVEGWNMLDRIVWQDVDAGPAEPGAARRAPRLGGRRRPPGHRRRDGRSPDAGRVPGRPAPLPADRDHRRPAGRPQRDSSARSRTAATDLPALSGDLIEGRALATVGDRVVAGERAYGLGLVTLLGFDPAASWIGESKASDGLWRRLLPPRTSGGLVFSDDNMLVSAVSQLPSLALPPIGGLIVLLGAYILLIGPINYLVLRRLDRREWAWLTMPLLIVVFTVGAYGFGAALRGNDVIVNEVAIVVGRPGRHRRFGAGLRRASSRRRAGATRCSVPGGALLSSPINDFFGGQGDGHPARRPAGRSRPGPRSRRRLRIAPDHPRRDARQRAADRDRPAARERPAQGDRHEPSRRNASSDPRSSSAGRWPRSTDLEPGAESQPSTPRSRTSSSGSRCPTRSSARSSSATAARTPTRRRSTSATRWSTS